MQEAIEQIAARYHPKQLTFTRAGANELLTIFGKTREELDVAWPDIENSLAQHDLWMMPALPDAEADEEIRIYRRSAPLTKILIEALNPSPNGDRDVMVPAIKALNLIKHGNRPGGGQPRRGPQTSTQKPDSNGRRDKGMPRYNHKPHKAGYRQNNHPKRSHSTAKTSETQSYDPSYSASAHHLTRPLD